MRGERNNGEPFRSRTVENNGVDPTNHNPKPTRAPLERREASPDKYATSGMERALGSLADKTHKC